MPSVNLTVMRRLTVVTIAATLALLAVGTAVTSPSLPIYLPCNDARGEHVYLRHAPQECIIQPTGASLAVGAALGDLRWQHWGSAIATATGVTRRFYFPNGWTRVTVLAYDLTDSGYCTGRFRVYRRLRISTRWGSGVISTEGCTI